PAVAEDETPTPPELKEITGTWVGDVRQTNQGPMSFVFRLGGDRSLEVVGTPVTPGGEEFRRSGKYRWADGSLTTPALNQGQPIRLALTDDHLTVTIDDTLLLRLRRE